MMMTTEEWNDKPTGHHQMSHLTDKELDALDAKLASQIGDDVAVIFNHEYLFKQSRIAITALRAQIADAQAELHGPIKHLSAQDYSNVIAHLSPELEPNGELPNRNSLMMALVEASNAAKRESDRADRAEVALAAQIEMDARIAEEEGWEQDKPHLGITEREDGSRDCAERIAAAIRNQPHDRTALDRIIADTMAERDDLRTKLAGFEAMTMLDFANYLTAKSLAKIKGHGHE